MPLIFKYKGFKIRFYMNEESRMHVHAVYENGGEIKVWLNPKIEVAKITGNFSDTIINQILKEIKDKERECKNAWNKYHR
jgi:hypothetical protein